MRKQIKQVTQRTHKEGYMQEERIVPPREKIESKETPSFQGDKNLPVSGRKS